MPKINKKDFVEIEYTGRIKYGEVFDTTDVDTAKQNNIYNQQINYAPAIVCVGENQIIKGLDKYLEGREVGEEYEVELKPDESFGKKDAKLLKIIPSSILKKQNITPFTGLQLNIDGLIGTIRAVTGGRIVIDFNHPLAGRDLIYKIKIKRLVKDTKEKINSYLRMQFNITNADIGIKEKKAEINLKTQIPKEALDELKEKLIKITEMTEIIFKKEEKKAEPNKNNKKGTKKEEKTAENNNKEKETEEKNNLEERKEEL